MPLGAAQPPGPVTQGGQTLRAHKEGIFAYFTHRITTAVCEGFNSVIETIKKNARGFRCFAHFRDRILFHLGRLDLRTPATAPA
ncbi:MAG: transposase [Verrucomicrobia bacterium]|nr:transposase [Verrucomicrobiota bacterium]